MTFLLPVAEPHDWSYKSLLVKAQRYSEEMHSCESDDWKFVLWSSLSLELLGRGVLANFGRPLLADLNNRDNLFFALGLPVKSKKFEPRSIAVSEVFERLNLLIPEFDGTMKSFAILHMNRRNEELHSASTPFDGLKQSSWLPQYYLVSEVLLKSVGKSLDDFLHHEHVEAANKMIVAHRDESAKSILKFVTECQAKWKALDRDVRARETAKSEAWATRQAGHRVECPACSNAALVYGEPSAPAVKTIFDDEITETQQFLPSRFECIACGLRISGLSQLTVCGLGDPYKATYQYDASEYYLQRDAEDGYEPDYNER